MNLVRFFFSKTFFKQLALAFIVFFIFCYLALSFLKTITYHDKLQEVPDLKGVPLFVLIPLIEEENLRFEIIDSSRYIPEMTSLSVLEHHPKAGDFVKKNRKIYITLNPSNYKKVSVPNVVQITKRNAETTLQSVGFSIGEITYRDNIGKNMVLEIKHKGKILTPGTLLPKTAKIHLVLGNGKRK